MDPYLILGILGMALILLAFFMTQTHRWSADSLTYDAVNFVGSAFLVIYAIPPRAWPFIVLNGVWALVSLKDIFSDVRGGRKG